MKSNSESVLTDVEYITPGNENTRKAWPMLIFHMLIFGGSGFGIAYFADDGVGFLYAHGGFAIFVYLVFYIEMFGIESVKWMFINAALGVFGLYSEIEFILAYFGKNIDDYAWYVHVIPFLYYVMYTFLLRQVCIEICGVRNDLRKSETVSYIFVGVSVIIYVYLYLN